MGRDGASAVARYRQVVLPTSPPDPSAGGEPRRPVGGTVATAANSSTSRAASDGARDAEPPADGPTGPSGWNRDPWSRHQSRFFDGRLWTEHVADGGIASVDSTPVADLPRSRPRPAREAPPDGAGGPRVLDDPTAGCDADAVGFDHALLLVDLVPGADGVRRLVTPDDVTVGRITRGRSSLLTRIGRGIVAAPSTTVTRLAVRDQLGADRIRLTRPGRRTVPVVDVAGAHGALGSIVAETVRQGLRARVLDPDGHEVGRLEQAAGDASSLRVLGADGVTLARLTPVWDVPGTRQHLPPGVVLLDRRRPDGTRPDTATADLLLAAALAPTLLAAPGGPTDR